MEKNKFIFTFPSTPSPDHGRPLKYQIWTNLEFAASLTLGEGNTRVIPSALNSNWVLLVEGRNLHCPHIRAFKMVFIYPSLINFCPKTCKRLLLDCIILSEDTRQSDFHIHNTCSSTLSQKVSCCGNCYRYHFILLTME